MATQIAEKAQSNIEPIIRSFQERYASRFGGQYPPWFAANGGFPSSSDSTGNTTNGTTNSSSTPSVPPPFNPEACRTAFRQMAERFRGSPWSQDFFRDHPNAANTSSSGGNLSDESLAFGLEKLSSMGFDDEPGHATDLLKRYNGSVERVVEILVQEREHKYT